MWQICSMSHDGYVRLCMHVCVYVCFKHERPITKFVKEERRQKDSQNDMNSFTLWPSACDVTRPYAPQTMRRRHSHSETHRDGLRLVTYEQEFEEVLLKVNHCVTLSRVGGRDNCRAFVWVRKGGGKEFVGGEGRWASLCAKWGLKEIQWIHDL